MNFNEFVNEYPHCKTETKQTTSSIKIENNTGVLVKYKKGCSKFKVNVDCV